MKRYIIAIIISALGVFASYHFLRPSDWSGERKKSDKPLAKISKVLNDVKKKAKGKMIWNSITDGVQLYQGEMVRTAQDSSASLEFIETGSIIDLEPGSTVLIEMMKKNVSLDVLSGGLFVKSVEKDGRSISLKSGKKTVDLSDGDLSFSVGAKGDVGVQVHRGKVSANIGGKNVTLSDKDIGTLTDKGIDKEENKFVDVRPALGETVYISQTENKLAKFQWKPLEKGYSIQIKIGTDRNRLENVTMKKIVPGESGQLISEVKLGTYYWQLVATANAPGIKPFQSIIYKNNFMSRIPPVPLSPAVDEIVYLLKAGRPLKFEWATPVSLDRTIIEISTDPEFKKVDLQYSVTQGNNLTIQDIAKTGDYFWRVKGTLQNSNTIVISSMQKFTIRFGEELRPPQLITPLNNKKLFLEGKSNNSLFFVWNQRKEVEKYKFLMRGLGDMAGFTLEREKQSAQIGIKNLKPGIYNWSVASIRKDGKISDFSEVRRVYILANMPQLEWLEGSGNHQYVGEKKPIQFKWSNNISEATSWKIKIADNNAFKDAQINEVENNQFIFRPQADGIYFAKVSAYDKDESEVAKSPTLSFEISQMPLPDPPEFDELIKNPIVSSKSGKLEIAFKMSKNVDKYLVEVKDLNGNIIQQVRLQNRSGIISSLMPGNYWISGRSIDKFGRMGPSGESRRLNVPQESNIIAPTVDKIIIK